MLKKLTAISICVFLVIIMALAASCGAPETKTLKVVTGTSLMEYTVKQVAGERVDVVNLVPPNQHPGNYDAKPGDILKLADADLFLLHGWPGEGYADKLIYSAANPKLKVVKAMADGNWMIPSVQLAATEKVKVILSEIDNNHTPVFEKAALEYGKKIQAKETEIKARLSKANINSVKVIASVRQADFLKWAGFDVVATFAGPQSLTLPAVKELIDKGKAQGVTLVINNLQDGQDAGKMIAQDIGAKNLNLSNFPGGFENTETWEKAVEKNIEIVLDAVSK